MQNENAFPTHLSPWFTFHFPRKLSSIMANNIFCYDRDKISMLRKEFTGITRTRRRAAMPCGKLTVHFAALSKLIKNFLPGTKKRQRGGDGAESVPHTPHTHTHTYLHAYLANTLSAFSTCFAHNSNVLSLFAFHVIFFHFPLQFFSALCLNNYFPQ